MPIKKGPSYARDWKAKRQTRVKASGMTEKLQKYDTLWREYDRDYFIANVTGNNPVNDADRYVKGMQAALADVEQLARTHDKAYNAAEKAVLKKFYDDVNDEVAFWKEYKRKVILTLAGAKEARVKLLSMMGKLFEAMKDLEIGAKKVQTQVDTLQRAAALRDHDAAPGAYKGVAIGVQAMMAQWKQANERHDKVNDALVQASTAHGKDPVMAGFISDQHRDCSAARRRLAELSTDAKGWLTFAQQGMTAKA